MIVHVLHVVWTRMQAKLEHFSSRSHILAFYSTPPPKSLTSPDMFFSNINGMRALES